MLRLCRALFGFRPPGMAISEISDFFCRLFAHYFPDFYVVSDNTLQKGVIGNSFLILGTKAGVLPKFQGEIPKLLISGDRLVQK